MPISARGAPRSGRSPGWERPGAAARRVRFRRHAGRGLARPGRGGDRPARSPRAPPAGGRRGRHGPSAFGRDPDRSDRGRRGRPGPRRRHPLSRRPRAPGGHVPARRRPGPPRDHVPCRPRVLAGTGRGARHARAGGPRQRRPGCSSSARARRSPSTSARPRTASLPGPRSRPPSPRSTASLPPHDLAHYRGRLVVDLRPRDAGGKREAFEALLAELRPATVVAFGDDMQRRRRLRGPARGAGRGRPRRPRRRP